MKLKLIDNIQELLCYMPTLLESFRRRPWMFGKKFTEEQFVKTIIDDFMAGRGLTAGARRGDKVGCFFHTQFDPNDDNVLVVWYAYSDPHFRKYTVAWIKRAVEIAASFGRGELQWYSYYITRSYRRFIAKLGAKPIRVMYSLNVEDKLK